MRSFKVFLFLLFAFATTSHAWPSVEFPTLELRNHGNETKPSNPKHSLKNLCRKMRKLTALSTIADNQTKLDAWVSEGKLDTADVDAIKSKAANATKELQNMQSNTTLVNECAVVDAERKSINQCKLIKKLNKLAVLAGNETAMVAFEKKNDLNETGIERLKAKVKDASIKLQEMQSNTTLTDFCTQRQQQEGGSEFIRLYHVFCLYTDSN